MEKENYPSLYQAADKASVKYQKIYTRLMGLNLAFMIAGALLSILKPLLPYSAVWIYSISFAMLIGSVIMTFTLKLKKYEDVWYQGRALAESMKTLTWRFITRSEGFETPLSIDDCTRTFIEKTQELTTKFKEYTQHLDSKILTLPNVTELMKEINMKSYDERKKYYTEFRIEDQKVWYSDKAEYNRKKQNLWFILILAAQFLAIFSAVYLIKFPESNWNIVGLFTTIASVGVAWLQLKQYQEHRQAYNTATMELQFIKEKGLSIGSEADFSKYVLDSENAISREHTLWLVQKRK